MSLLRYVERRYVVVATSLLRSKESSCVATSLPRYVLRRYVVVVATSLRRMSLRRRRYIAPSYVASSLRRRYVVVVLSPLPSASRFFIVTRWFCGSLVGVRRYVVVATSLRSSE